MIQAISPARQSFSVEAFLCNLMAMRALMLSPVKSLWFGLLIVVSALGSMGLARAASSTLPDSDRIIAREAPRGLIPQADSPEIAPRTGYGKPRGCSAGRFAFEPCQKDWLHDIAVIGTDQRSAVNTKHRKMASVGHVRCEGMHKEPDGSLKLRDWNATATIVVPREPNHARHFETVLTAKHAFYSPSGIKANWCTFNTKAADGRQIKVELPMPTSLPTQVPPEKDRFLAYAEEDIAIIKINRRLTACPEGKERECGASVTSLNPRPDLVPFRAISLTREDHKRLIDDRVDFGLRSSRRRDWY